MSYLRSLLFSIPLIFLSTVFMGALSLAASFFDRTGNSQHRIARIWGRMVLAVSFIHVRAEGLEKLDPHGSYVFVANHASFMDIPAILSRLPYQFRFFAKKGLFRIPFLGTHLQRAGHLPEFAQPFGRAAAFRKVQHADAALPDDARRLLHALQRGARAAAVHREMSGALQMRA